MPYGNEDYIYAQVLLRDYPHSVGDLGDAYGDTSWIGPAITAVSSLASAGIQAGAAGQAGKQASQIAQSEAELAAAQAALAAQSEAAATERAKTYAMYGAGAVVLVALIGGGSFLAWKAMQ